MKTIARLLALLLVAAAAGCTRWAPPSALPAPEEGPVTYASARVTPRTTGMMVMHNVRVTADSVTGRREGAPDRSGLLRGPSKRVALHRSEVLLFEPAEPDGWATVGGALLAVLVAFGLYVADAVGSSG